MVYRFLPFILLLLTGGLLLKSLLLDDNVISDTTQRPLPEFVLSDLHSQQQVTEKQLNGQPGLLHVWASWCQLCRQENHFIVQLSQRSDLAIYGLNYRDDRKKALQWLEQWGDPYRRVIEDPQGELALKLGVYGTPESYLINCQGEIIYRHIGLLDQQLWLREFEPRLEALRCQ